MIHSITSDKSSFKTIKFQPGFNVILADRTTESTAKDTRNGLGKSTLTEIIHFCLGGLRGSTLLKKQVEDWTFTLELDLGRKKFLVSRNTKEQSHVTIKGDCSNWEIQPETNDLGKQTLSNEDWKKILGIFMFNLESEYKQKYHPKFRSLFSYFVRPAKEGGYLTPIQQFKQQLTWDIQVHNAYLLNLGWEFASEWQILKDKEKLLNSLKKETDVGILSDLIGKKGELAANKIRLKDQIEKEEVDMQKFKVHKQYSDLEKKSNELTESIHKMVNQDITDRKLLEHYQSSLTEETDAEPEQVTKIYEEAGFVFSEKIVKKLDDVLEFHKKIVMNRKEFLNSEITNLKYNIKIRKEEIQKQDSERSDLLLTLKSHGALKEFLRLQVNHQKLIAEFNDIQRRLDSLKKFDEGKSALAIEREILYQNTTTDLNSREKQKEESIRIFNSHSEYLYKVPGTLSIDVDKTGYKFNINIQRDGSYGFQMMKIFCYDLMLAKLWTNKVESNPFLIHDSIIFADVDERQTALALQLAESSSREYGFQYICTMNSDVIPYDDFDGQFDFKKFVVSTFTDATEDGGLLGIRF